MIAYISANVQSKLGGCFVPEVVLVSLLHHGHHNHEEQRQQPRLGGDGRVDDPGQNQGHLYIISFIFCQYFSALTSNNVW